MCFQPVCALGPPLTGSWFRSSLGAVEQDHPILLNDTLPPVGVKAFREAHSSLLSAAAKPQSAKKSSTGDMAEESYVSQKTVKNHLASIYLKLGVNDRARAVVEAMKLGLDREWAGSDE